MDTLVFGDVPILRYFFSKGRPILKIDPIIARQELGLSRKAFIDFCILCGTDFSGTIQGIGPHRALKAMRKYGSIEKLLENLDDKYVPQPTFNYQLAREVNPSLCLTFMSLLTSLIIFLRCLIVYRLYLERKKITRSPQQVSGRYKNSWTIIKSTVQVLI